MIKVTLLLLALVSSNASAKPSDVPYLESKQFAEDVKAHLTRGVDAQIARLTQLAPRPKTQECLAKYDGMWRTGILQLDLFYGYMNNQTSTLILDPIEAQVMTEVLTRKCVTPMAGACGFKVISKPAKQGKVEAKPTALKRTIKRYGQKQDFIIRIFTSALTERGPGNQNVQQSQKSENVWNAFLTSLGQANVVIYDGHGRYGAGPGFDTEEHPLNPDGSIERSRFERFKSGLVYTLRKPDLLMIAACDSRNHYLKEILEIAPYMSTITTTDDDQSPGAGIQTVYSVIDSLVVERCEDEMKEALALVPDRADYGPNGQVLLENFTNPAQ
ncbi:MAG: hypothetical protein V4736_02645 [Bdellovibrionota bacterium]